ncbi:hypothetical protein, partial [Flammeovirga sp. OC4]|uniref:hypothetical protein n=1 Tax=Flammeovirga sp. OC4 TaxID=1382345 RepID=UPI0005C73AC8
MTNKIYFFSIALFTFLCFSVYAQDDVIIQRNQFTPSAGQGNDYGKKIFYSNDNNLLITVNDNKVITYGRNETDDYELLNESPSFIDYSNSAMSITVYDEGNSPTTVNLIKTDYNYIIEFDPMYEGYNLNYYTTTDYPVLMGINESDGTYYYGLYVSEAQRYEFYTYFDDFPAFFDYIMESGNSFFNNIAIRLKFGRDIYHNDQTITLTSADNSFFTSIEMTIVQDGTDDRYSNIYVNEGNPPISLKDSDRNLVYEGSYFDGSATHYLYYVYVENWDDAYVLFDSFEDSFENFVSSMTTFDHIDENRYEDNYRYTFLPSTDVNLTRTISDIDYDNDNNQLIIGFADHNINQGIVEKYNYTPELLGFGTVWDIAESIKPATAVAPFSGFGEKFAIGRSSELIETDQGLIVFQDGSPFNAISLSSEIKGIEYFDNISGVSDNSAIIWTQDQLLLFHFDTYSFFEDPLNAVPEISSLSGDISDVEIIQNSSDFLILMSYENDEKIYTYKGAFSSSSVPYYTLGSVNDVISPFSGSSTNYKVLFSHSSRGTFAFSRNESKLIEINYDFAKGELTTSDVGSIPYSGDETQFGQDIILEENLFISTLNKDITEYGFMYQTANDGNWSDAATWKNGLMPLGYASDIIKINNNVTKDDVSQVNADILEIVSGATLSIPDGNSSGFSVDTFTNYGTLNIGEQNSFTTRSGTNHTGASINVGNNDDLYDAYFDLVQTSDDARVFLNEGTITVNEGGFLYINGNWKNGAANTITFTEVNDNSGYSTIEVYCHNKDMTVDFVDLTFPEISLINDGGNLKVTGDIHSNKELNAGESDYINMEEVNLFIETPIATNVSIDYDDLTINNLTISNENHNFSGSDLSIKGVLDLKADFYPFGNVMIEIDNTKEQIIGDHGIVNASAGYYSGPNFVLALDLANKPSSFSIDIPFVNKISGETSEFIFEAPLSFNNVTPTYPSVTPEIMRVNAVPNISYYFDNSYVIGAVEYYEFKNRSWYINIENLDQISGGIATPIENAVPYYSKSDSDYNFILNDINAETDGASLLSGQSITDDVISGSFSLSSTDFTISLTSLTNQKLFHSISNGAWDATDTWDLFDTPSSADTVVVRHNVDIISSFGGEITEGEGGFVGEPTVGELTNEEEPIVIISPSGGFSANAVKITTRVEDDVTEYGSLYIDGSYFPVTFNCSNIVIDTDCSLDLDSYAAVVINEITESSEEEIVIPEGKSSTNPVIEINGDVYIGDNSYLNIYRDINWNGVLNSNENGTFAFYGNIISGSTTLDVSNFSLSELDTDDQRVININVPINIIANGSIESQGELGINFNNGFSMASTAQIDSLGYVTISGDESASSDVLDIYTIEHDTQLVPNTTIDGGKDNFLSLTINDYETVNFHNNMVIAQNLVVSNSNDNKTIINHHGDDFKFNYNSNNFDTPLDVISFTNVDKFIGNLDAATSLEVNWNGHNYNRPTLDNSTTVSNFNSTGDSVFLIKPNNVVDLFGNFGLLAQQPDLFFREKQLLDGSYVQTNVIQSNEDSIYFNFTVATLSGGTRGLDPDEKINIYYNDTFVSNATYTIIPKSADGSVTQEAYGFRLSTITDQGFDTKNYQDLTIKVALEHKTLANSESELSSITYLYVPSGFVHNADRQPFVDFVKSLTFINEGTLFKQFNWEDADLTSWLNDGNVGNLESLADYLDINGEGRIQGIDFTDKNINGIDFTTLDLRNELSSEGDIILTETELLNTPVLGMEYLGTLTLEDNYLDFTDLAGYDDGTEEGSFTFNLVYTTPAIPFETFGFVYSKGDLASTYTFDTEGNYSYATIAWKDITDSENSIDIDDAVTSTINLADSSVGNYVYRIVITSSAETFENISAPQLEFDLNVKVNYGELEDQELFDFLTALGGYESISRTDSMRKWADPAKFVIDESGYVTDIDISGLNLTSVPTEIFSFSKLSTLNIGGNQLFFDDIDALNAGFTSNGLTVDITTGSTQTYTYTAETPIIYRGEASTYTPVISYSETSKLVYNWYLDDIIEEGINTSSYTVPEENDTFDDINLKLVLGHNDYEGLSITVAEYTFDYTLGRKDSVALYDLMVALGIGPDLALNMRQWVDEDDNSIATQIDDYGGVISLDLSGRNLTSIPEDVSSLTSLQDVNISDNNLNNVDLTEYINDDEDNVIFNVDDNRLFFDDLVANRSFIDEDNLNAQIFDTYSTTSEVITYGSNRSYNGTVAGDNLIYNWVRESDNSNYQNTPILNFPFMTEALVDTYILNVTSSDLAGLSIEVARYTAGFTLGQEDSVALYNLFVELGTTPDKAIEMRDWVDNDGKSVATQIDNYGRVIDLDLSNRALTSLPTSLTI